MKNSETEREITELIKGTLDSYQEDYIPGAWDNFVRFRERRKRTIILRVASGIAACLIAGLIGFNYFGSHFTVKPETAIVKNSDRPAMPANNKAAEKGQLSPDRGMPCDIVANNGSSARKNAGFDSKSAPSAAVHRQGNDSKTGINPSAFANVQGALKKQEENSTALTTPVDSFQASRPRSAGSSDSTAADSASKKFKAPERRSFSEHDLLQKFAANANQTPAKRKVRIGINFSPGVNSTQSGTAFNYSGGVTTDIRLFSDILLSTGLQIEHQSVVNGGNSSAALSDARIKADLLNLDLPLNITWKFFSDKSKSFYVSGGVSSLAYLSEKYDKTVSVWQLAEVKTMVAGAEKLAYKVENLESNSQVKEPSFNTIDIAGRVNVLFGVEQRLSPKLSLHIEPYMKIPVSGLASENLRFSTGGVTCKISF